ncbi:MAG: hypothetical protein OEY97_01415 [Nitrospirota bacterium]|nr:hypothetical protein [Nitrospirota bacterium]
MDTAAIQTQLQEFSKAYKYDTAYLEELLNASPGAFGAFSPGMEICKYRKALPLDAYFVACVATMKGEECGPCGQLNLRMAVEAGVDRELLALVIKKPNLLPSPLRDVHDHAFAVTQGPLQDPERAERIRKHYGDEAFAELAVCITGNRVFPTLKRALMKADHCEILTLDF